MTPQQHPDATPLRLAPSSDSTAPPAEPVKRSRPDAGAALDPTSSLMLTREQVAALLGVGLSTFDSLRDAKKMIPPAIRITDHKGKPRTLRWSRLELERWCLEGCPDPKKWRARKDER